MRKISMYLLLLLLSIIMLVACGEEEEKGEQDDVVTETDAGEKDKGNTDEEAGDVTKEETPESSSPSGVEEILQKTAEAMQTVGGMNVTGETTTSTEIASITENKTSKISGKISMNPYGQYMKFDEESEEYGASSMEMYITEEGMYISDPDSGWLSMPVEQEGLMSELPSYTTEHSLLSYVKVADLFELTEDDDHYILTFEGSGEDYKKVTYGYLKELTDEETYEVFAGDIIEGSGSLVLTIDKSTFYVVAIQNNSDVKMDLPLDPHTIDQTSYIYSDFGEAGEVIVPDEVVDNAKTLDMLMEMDE